MPYADLEKKRATNAAWRSANPGYNAAWRKANPEKERARNAAWRKANPDKKRASNAASYWANPDKHRARHRANAAAWRKANAEQVKAYSQLRRALLKGAPGPGLLVMKEYWQTIKHLPCICGATGKMTLDHIIPLSRGGHHAPYNVQPLCHSCNSGKGAKDFADWLRYSDT